MLSTHFLRHGRVNLALHQLRDGSGLPLLCLHGLGERTAGRVHPYLQGWSGPIYGLDFTGHGESTVAVGGGYTAEILVADADTALQEIGEAALFGRGLGGYIGLLLTGARPTNVLGTVIADGPGLAGGGVHPGSPSIFHLSINEVRTPDPYALVDLARDVRPPDYAAAFARMVVQHSPLDEPVAVSAVVRPEWVAAVIGEPGVVDLPVEKALALYDRPA